MSIQSKESNLLRRVEKLLNIKSRKNETVDVYDLKSVLDDLNYECSYVTDLEKDGDLFTAWFIHEKDERGFAGKQIKDADVYYMVAKKIEREFGEKAQVITRLYKYAPEQSECMLLLPITGAKEFNNLKPGDKFTMEGYDGTCEVVERTEDGNWECKAPTVGDGWTYFDLYVEDMNKVKLIKNESLNESEGIYNPGLILQAYKKEQEWLNSLNLDDELAPEVMLFIIEDKEIKDTKLVKREDVYTYQPNENEYYLDRTRDSGDIITDYNLEPVQKLVDRWNEGKVDESYHFSVEDIGISGNNWVFPEEAYKEAKSRLSKLGYRVSDLTDDLEFKVIGDSTGVAYDGVIYSNESLNESVPDENLDKIYKVLDYYMTKLGFELVKNQKDKKYRKIDNSNYTHTIDFTPQMDNDHLKYEVRDERGNQKLCDVYNILDATDMDTTLQIILFDMEGFE